MADENEDEHVAPAQKSVADLAWERLPRLKWFDRDQFFKFDWRALVLDVMLVTFALLLSHNFFGDKGLFQRMEPWQVLAMFCVVVLTMPYYLGYLYVCFSRYLNKPALKVLLWLFILITLMILVNLVRLTLSMENVEEFRADESGFFAVFGMFMLVLGPMMCIGGAMQARDDMMNPVPNYKFDSDRMATMGSFFIIILAIAFMIMITGAFPEAGGWIAIIAMFGGCFAAVLVFGLFIGMMSLLDKIGIYKYLVILARNTFPLFLIAILVFWSGVTIDISMHDFAGEHGHVSRGGLLFSILISGLLPFRIIMLLSPPVRLLHLLLGSAVMIYFIISLFGLI